MTSLHRPAGTLRSGSDPVMLTAGDAGWSYCGLQIVELAPGASRRFDLTGVEAAVVPLHGACHVETDGVSRPLTGRGSVFDGVPDVAYVPLGATLVVRSDDGARVAVATAAADDWRPAFVVDAGAVPVSIRGAGRATRRITGLLSADIPGPQRLMVVEVFTPGGNWSSYPPHKHDEWGPSEVPIEEIYYYEMAGDAGFGIHRTYTTDGAIDETVVVRDGDVFLIPRGYHGPCVAAPGYDMYYLNVMAGPDSERRWLICNDPDHAWVIDTWADTPVDERVGRSVS